MSIVPPVIGQMEALIRQWDEVGDDRALFLKCYRMMTNNMFGAIQMQEFRDPAWVDRLLHSFAEYYFSSLRVYEHNPDSAPAVWRLAHDAAGNPDVSALRKMLLGVNAHINYDLVLVLAELLRPEWKENSASRRADRYADYSHVNAVIGRTIDRVQDEVVETAMPFMDIVDRLLGPIDEMLLSRLITHWRERVWQDALRLLEMTDAREQFRVLREVEEDALKTGVSIVG